MISILIPTYNYNSLPLAKLMHTQALALEIPFEIIVADDASTDFSFLKFNRKINALSNCEFIELKQNKGRSAIRNYLTTKANYEWLLFLDVDTQPTNKNFLETYIKAIEDTVDVIYGGIYYLKNDNPQNSLRYLFGTERESISLSKRLENPYKYFITMAFLIRKRVFSKVRFSENLIQYGYEDVVFALQLRNANFKLKHIDNTITHLNLESNEVFLMKSKLSLKSLLSFYQNYEINATDTKLLSIYESLKKLKLVTLSSHLFTLFRKPLEKKLLSKTPSLRMFDFYRLGLLCLIATQKDA